MDNMLLKEKIEHFKKNPPLVLIEYEMHSYAGEGLLDTRFKLIERREDDDAITYDYFRRPQPEYHYEVHTIEFTELFVYLKQPIREKIATYVFANIDGCLKPPEEQLLLIGRVGLGAKDFEDMGICSKMDFMVERIDTMHISRVKDGILQDVEKKDDTD